MAEKKTGFKKIKENKSKKIKNWNKISKIQLLTANWEFKKKGRLPQRNCHIKIELSVISTVFRLFHVVHVVSALLLAWHECFSHKGRKWKIFCYGPAFSSEPQYEDFMKMFWSSGRQHQNIAPKSMPHVENDCFPSFNQTKDWFVALSLPLTSSFLKLPDIFVEGSLLSY